MNECKAWIFFLTNIGCFLFLRSFKMFCWWYFLSFLTFCEKLGEMLTIWMGGALAVRYFLYMEEIFVCCYEGFVMLCSGAASLVVVNCKAWQHRSIFTTVVLDSSWDWLTALKTELPTKWGWSVPYFWCGLCSLLFQLCGAWLVEALFQEELLLYQQPAWLFPWLQDGQATYGVQRIALTSWCDQLSM